MISFGDGAEESYIDALQALPTGMVVQVVRTGQTFIDDRSGRVNEQDFLLLGVQSDGLVVLERIDANCDPFGEHVLVSLDDVERIHIY